MADKVLHHVIMGDKDSGRKCVTFTHKVKYNATASDRQGRVVKKIIGLRSDAQELRLFVSTG